MTVEELPPDLFFARFSSLVRDKYDGVLDCNVIRCSDKKLLHIWRRPSSSFLEDLADLEGECREIFFRLVPDFHVFAWFASSSAAEMEADVELKLVFTTYRGKVLLEDRHAVELDECESSFGKLFSSDAFLINRLTDKDLVACKGASFEARVLQKYLKDRSCKDILVEEAGSGKTVRSRNCAVALFRGELACSACSDLRDDVNGFDSDSTPQKRRRKGAVAAAADEESDLVGGGGGGGDDDDNFYAVMDFDFNLGDNKGDGFDVESSDFSSYAVSLLKVGDSETDSAPIDAVDSKQCPKCRKRYTFANSCKRHVEKCDGIYRGRKRRRSTPKQQPKAGKVVAKSEVEQERERQGRICPLCLMEHKRFATLQSHLGQHKAKIDVEAIVECPLCQTAVTKLSLNQHFSTAHPDKGSGICCECFKIGKVKGSLKHHFARHHKYESNSVLCTECGRGFMFHHELRVHYAENHDKGGASTVVCDQCGKTFHHRKRLVSHLRASHRKSIRFECHLCEKVFYQHYQLVKHLQIHTGVKPWKCAHCDYRSVRKDNVLLHCRKVHRMPDASGERDVVKADGVEPPAGGTSVVAS